MTRILLVACVLAAGADALAGRIPGPGRKTAHVQGFAAVTYKVKFAPGQPAVVRVVGDGDSPMAVGVYDSAGRPAAVDTKSTDRFELRWTPRSPEPYTIKVMNRGGVPIRFVLRTN